MHMSDRVKRKSATAAFVLMLVLGVIPAVISGNVENAGMPVANAQTTAEAPLSINSVHTGQDNDFTVRMTATQAMKMREININSSTRLAAGRVPATLKSLTVNGQQYPTSLIRATSNSLSVYFDSDVDIQPGTPFTIGWVNYGTNRASVNTLTATVRGTEIAIAPQQGNPLQSGRFQMVPISTSWAECSLKNGLLYSKRWWNKANETDHTVKVVEVTVKGVANLADSINTADPRLQLRFGSKDAGWTEIHDYFLTVSGNSVFFELETPQARTSDINSYDVEARIPFRGTDSGCDMTMWTLNDALPLDHSNPVATGNYVRLLNSRAWDECKHEGGRIYAKTWWDDTESWERQGGVNIVEVKIPGVDDLAGKLNVSDPGIKLRFGSENYGWTELNKNTDYTLSASDESVFFNLNKPHVRADRSQTSYDVEAFIPIMDASIDCRATKVNLWRERTDADPEWLNPAAPPLDLDVAETPRDSLDWLPASAQNPALPQRCGGNIAFVFDTSDSVYRKDPETGESYSRSITKAGLQAINALQGTASKVAIYNFASHANSLSKISTVRQGDSKASLKDLKDPEQVQELRHAVQAFKDYEDSEIRGYSRYGRGGTNYEAGLSQVPDDEFDVVYFITDGLPTTSSRDYPYGFDIGLLINQSDLSAAVKEANRLKESGTRIETIMVGFKPFNEHILKDDYFQLQSVRDQQTPLVPGVPYSSIKKPWPHLEGFGYPSYYGSADSVRELVTNGEITIGDIPDSNKAVKYDITNQPEIWRAAVRNTKTIASDISSPDAVTTVARFTDLATKLSELVLQNCFGTLNVTKKIEGDNGKQTPGKDWKFETTVVGNHKVIIDGEELKSSVEDLTDENGSFGRVFNQPNRKSTKVNVIEHQQDGYALRKQDGKNAVCEANVFDGKRWSKTTSRFQNIDDVERPGFSVDIPFRGNVNCTIVNAMHVDVAVTVRKVNATDKPEPLEGAEFTVSKVSGEDIWTRTVSQEMPTVQGLKSGETYELIETKAPEGYQLLTKAVRFSVENGESGPRVVLDGGPEQYPQIMVNRNHENSSGVEFIMQVADIRKGDLPLVGGIGVGWMAFAAGIAAVAAIFLGRRSLS